MVGREGCGAVKEGGDSRTTVPSEERVLDAGLTSPPKTGLQAAGDLQAEGATLHSNAWDGGGGGQETSTGKDLPGPRYLEIGILCKVLTRLQNVPFTLQFKLGQIICSLVRDLRKDTYSMLSSERVPVGL